MNHRSRAGRITSGRPGFGRISPHEGDPNMAAVVDLVVLAAALVEAFVRGGKVKPVLPEGRRDEVVAALTRLMLDTEARDAYAAALDAERRRQGVGLLL